MLCHQLPTQCQEGSDCDDDDVLCTVCHSREPGQVWKVWLMDPQIPCFWLKHGSPTKQLPRVLPVTNTYFMLIYAFLNMYIFLTHLGMLLCVFSHLNTLIKDIYLYFSLFNEVAIVGRLLFMVIVGISWCAVLPVGHSNNARTGRKGAAHNNSLHGHR